METELKLILDAETRQALLAHPLFQARHFAHYRQVTTYYDTPDLRLAAAGLSLRVREQNGAYRQTVKRTRAATGAAHTRDEWEWPLRSADPDTDGLGGLDLELPSLEGLAPVCTTDIQRQVATIPLDMTASIEAAFGDGEVRANGSREPIRELELEVKKGPSAAPYRMALQLSRIAPIALDSESKVERGLRLYRAEPTQARKAGRVALRRDMPVAQAAHTMIGHCLGHLLANLPAARTGQPEGVHQMRVAVRRLRSVLRLLRPLLEPHARARFETALRREGRIFGEARDWDVVREQGLPAAAQDASLDGWLPLLLEAAETRSAAAHDKVRADLAGRDFTDLVLALSAWVEDEGADPILLAAAADRPIGDCAGALLNQLARTVLKRGRHLGSGDHAQLHAVRRSLKKLRYAVEFLRELYPRREVKAWLKPCKRLLDALGALNDAVMLVRLLDRMVADGSPGLTPALGRIANWAEAQQAAAHARIGPLWNHYRSADPPWR